MSPFSCITGQILRHKVCACSVAARLSNCRRSACTPPFLLFFSFILFLFFLVHILSALSSYLLVSCRLPTFFSHLLENPLIPLGHRCSLHPVLPPTDFLLVSASFLPSIASWPTFFFILYFFSSLLRPLVSLYSLFTNLPTTCLASFVPAPIQS